MNGQDVMYRRMFNEHLPKARRSCFLYIGRSPDLGSSGRHSLKDLHSDLQRCMSKFEGGLINQP